MNQSSRKLSEDQREYLKPALEKVTDGLAELQEALIELGWEEGDFSCTRCDCSSFVGSQPPILRCARSTCGHRFTLHRVF
jgi:hypothetical protein